MALPWYLNELDAANPNKELTKALKHRLHALLNLCEELLATRADKVQDEVSHSISQFSYIL